MTGKPSKAINVDLASLQSGITADNFDESLKTWKLSNPYRFEIEYIDKSFVQIVGLYPFLSSEYGPALVITFILNIEISFYLEKSIKILNTKTNCF